MPNVIQEDIAVTRYLVPLVFQATDIPDAAGTASGIEPTTPEYAMPFRGSVVGISVRHNAALVGGTLTWRPTINGTANTGITTTTSSSAQGNQATKAANLVNFVKGARLGVDWTKSGTVNPTTTDATIVLWVLLEEVGL